MPSAGHPTGTMANGTTDSGTPSSARNAVTRSSRGWTPSPRPPGRAVRLRSAGSRCRPSSPVPTARPTWYRPGRRRRRWRSAPTAASWRRGATVIAVSVSRSRSTTNCHGCWLPDGAAMAPDRRSTVASSTGWWRTVADAAAAEDRVVHAHLGVARTCAWRVSTPRPAWQGGAARPLRRRGRRAAGAGNGRAALPGRPPRPGPRPPAAAAPAIPRPAWRPGAALLTALPPAATSAAERLLSPRREERRAQRGQRERRRARHEPAAPASPHLVLRRPGRAPPSCVLVCETRDDCYSVQGPGIISTRELLTLSSTLPAQPYGYRTLSLRRDRRRRRPRRDLRRARAGPAQRRPGARQSSADRTSAAAAARRARPASAPAANPATSPAAGAAPALQRRQAHADAGRRRLA